MKKRLTALLLAFCLFFSAAPVFAGAATGQRVSAGAVTVTAGNTASITLKAENFQNIAALDVYVYYDASVFTVSGTSNGNILSGAQASVNTAEAGTVTLSAMALDGMNGSGNFLTIRFTTRSDCQPGTYPITVAIGRAYTGDLTPAEISGVSGSVTIQKPAQTEYFSLSGSISPSTVQMGDVLSCQVNNAGYRSFVSGEFVFTYDHEKFAFDSVTLGSGLTGEEAVYSVNSSLLGQVRVAYANVKAISSYQLFTVKLKVIADVDGTATMNAEASNVYRENLSAYLPGSWSRYVTLKKQQLNDYPDAFLETEQMIAGQESTSVFYVEAGTKIAAGDFAITYDPTVLRCVAVEAAEGIGEKGGMVIINDQFQEGVIRFSYVNMSAYDETKLPLVKITWEPLRSPNSHYQITGAGVGVVTADQTPVKLDYVTDSNHIFIRTVVPPVCLADGYTDHVCACGENFQTDTTQKLGHDIHQIEAKEESCTEVGWGAYEGCSRCDYGTYVEIPALGHDEIHHQAQVQTCLGIGWASYITCGRCDYSSYEELPALGHDLVDYARQDATCTQIGWEAYQACSRCDYTTYVELPALGHDKIPHKGQEATCLEIGWDSYVTCNRCDYTTYVEIPALGHDEIHHQAQAQTCLEIGWDSYVTCSRCDYTTYVELPPLGHRILVTEPGYENPMSVQNTGVKPFDLIDGVYYSTNKTDNSSSRVTVKALVDFDLLLTYGVSSEEGFDTLVIALNGAQKAAISGEISNREMLLKLSAGDVLTFTYKKDGSASYGSDCGWFQLEPQGLSVQLPAEQGEPTCTKAVVCMDCGIEIKAALGHDMGEWHTTSEPTCAQPGTLSSDCSRCDYIQHKDIPVLGHDEIRHEGKAATCLEDGWMDYVTCSRCDYTTYTKVAALGHTFVNKVCIACEAAQDPSLQWDLSAAKDGSVMAYAYMCQDKKYLLEITGEGATADYASSSPFYSLYNKIGDIRICQGVTGIGNYLFNNLKINGNVYIADSVTTIGTRAFYGFSGPRTITIPASVTNIKNNAFFNAKNLILLLQGEALPTVGSAWSTYCGYYLQPQQVVETDDATYVIDKDGKAWLAKYCTDEEEFVAETVVNGVPVTGIGAYALYSKNKLKTFTIAKEIDEVGTYAFSGSRLTLLLESNTLPANCASSWNGSAPYYLAPQGVFWVEDTLYVQSSEGQMYLARHLGSQSEFIVPDYIEGLPVQHIGSYAFKNSAAQIVSLPDIVETIGERAFFGSLLKQIQMPDSLESIGVYSFYGTKLTEVTIPAGVCEIGTNAFYSCSRLKTVYIQAPAVAQIINSWTAAGHLCDYATTVVVPAQTENSWLEEVYGQKESAWAADMDCLIYSNCSHIWQETLISEMITCQTDGVTLSTCETCAVEKQFVVKCHDETHYEAKAPTCTQTGWKAYSVCSRCDYTTYEEVAAKGHSHDAVVTVPTCLEQGYTTHTCHCGDSYVDSYVTALGHSFTSYKSNNNATCTEDGTETAKCDRCDETNTRIVADSATGHSHTAVVTTPTCTEQGYTTHTCHCGDSYVDSYVDALGHSYAAVVTAPTCFAQGYTIHTCHCGDSYKDTYVAATGHTYVSTVVKPSPAAQGYTLHSCHCGDSYKDNYVAALDVSTPKVIITADAATGKPALSWANGSEGVTYEIHRATSKSGKYTRVATVAEPGWIDTSVSVGKTYYYKVKAIYAADTSFNSDFSAVVSVAAKCATAELTVKAGSSGKPVLTWNKVTSAKKYEIWRSVDGGAFKKLTTTTKLTYTDTKVTAGAECAYKVKALGSKSAYNGEFSETDSCYVTCAAPSITLKLDSKTGLPSLRWSKVTGAKCYVIYRSVNGSDYQQLTTTTSVSYQDKTAQIDNQYSYYVVTEGKEAVFNSVASAVKTVTLVVKTPKLTGTATPEGAPVVKWAAVENAVAYKIYRSTKSSKGFALVKTTEELTYTDTSVAVGKSYYYKVVAVGANTESAISSYLKLTGKCATPTIQVLANEDSGKPVITWQKITGAKKYTVYRATSETGKYTKLGTTTKLTYTDSKASVGTKYFYKIVANPSSSSANSLYSNIESCLTICAKPVVTAKVDTASGKPSLSWKKVTGAKSYEIYRSENGGAYILVATQTGVTYKDTTAVVDHAYCYQVKVIASKSGCDSFLSAEKTVTAACATPKLTGKVGATGKPALSWNAVDGATKYIVYRSTSKSKNYKVIDETDGLTYTDATATKGKTYYYKVVAVSGSTQSAQSSYAKIKSK